MKVFAVLCVLGFVVPVAWSATAGTGCRIAGTIVRAVLGSINGATLEAGCADASNACKNLQNAKPGIAIPTTILSSLGTALGHAFPGAGQVAEGALKLACSQVATGGKLATAIKGKNQAEASKAIAKLVCTPINYGAMVVGCNNAVKAAHLPKGSDLTKVKGCEKIQFIDNLGKTCIPHAA